jgi:molybdate transport system ATP-binding protein
MVSGGGGSGKTSLLKLITGENLQSYSNDVYLFGQKKGSGESVWEIKKNIGWISSELQSKYPLNIRGVEVVYSGFFDSVGLYRTASTAQRRQAEMVLSALGIDHLSEEAYGNLSHGQKQMLLIARAIVKSPLLLLLDEPCEGLDFSNRMKILEIMEFIGRHTPTTIVYATYDGHDVLPCISHRLHLDRGIPKITTIGSD